MQTPPNTDVPKQPNPSPSPTKRPWYRRTIRLSGQLLLLGLALGGLALLWLLVRPSGQPPTSTAQVATTTPQPTAVPSPTAQTVTVGGYTFGLPQAVPVDLSGTLEMIDWLPDSDQEIVAVHDRNQLISVNLNTGTVHQISPPFELGIRPEDVQLLADSRIIFRTYAPKLQTNAHIWIQSLARGARQATAPILTNPNLSVLVKADQKNLVLYDGQTQQASLVRSPVTNFQSRQAINNLTSLQELTLNPEPPYIPLRITSASSPHSPWTAVYSLQQFKLVKLETGEEFPLTLDAPQWVYRAYWSPDGQKLALLVTEGDVPYIYYKLFIVDLIDETLTEIKTDFRHITNVAWAPNSQDMVISADTGLASFPDHEDLQYTISDIFLVNITTKQIIPIPILPKESTIYAFWELAWSANGKTIALSGTLPDNLAYVHRITVEQ